MVFVIEFFQLGHVHFREGSFLSQYAYPSLLAYESGNKKDPLAFGWTQRYKVAVGVAEALEYLHNRDAQPVIHRDVKSSNILLSDDFEPQVVAFLFVLILSSGFMFRVSHSCFHFFQLSDFGLAKWASTTSTHITSTDVAGTFGFVTKPVIF